MSRTPEPAANADADADADRSAAGPSMAERLLAFDWAASPLGPPQAWPQPLKTLVDVMLSANQPMFVAWGPRRAMLYNDAYAEIMGTKHPDALGRPFDEVWAEIIGDVGPIMDRGYAGEPTAMDDIELVMVRRGYPEETHFSFFYAPVRDETGAVGGVYCACVETTEKVFAARRAAFRAALDARLRELGEPRALMAAAAEALGRHLRTTRCGYGEVDAGGERFSVEEEWTDGAPPSARGRFSIAEFGALLDDLRAGRAVVLDDASRDARTAAAAGAYAQSGIAAGISAPIVREGRLVGALYVHARDPRRWTQDEVALVREVAERTWAALELAKAQAVERRRAGQLQALAAASVAVAAAEGLPATLDAVNDAARAIVGAHQGVVAVTRAGDWAGSVVSVRLSDAYAAWRGFDAPPDGSGIYAFVCERNQPARFTQAELEAHPRWRGFGRFAAEHPPMRGWLAAPLVARDGANMGLVHLSDRADGGDFDEGDEAILVQLAQFASAAIERARAEEALRALAATLEERVAERTAERDRMWRLSTDLLAVSSFEGVLLAANPAFARVLGWRAQEIEGRPLADLVHPDDAPAGVAALALLRAGETVAFEDRRRARDGSWRWISWTAVPEGGAIYASGRDVTAEKERQEALEAAQEQLRQAQKMEAIGQLTGGVAHDFNNLLTIVRSSVDFLRRPNLPEERRRRYVEAISETVDRAVKLTGQLLAFARRQALAPEAFDAGERVSAVAEMLRAPLGAGVRIVLDVDATQPCWVEADVSQFETALVNMALNGKDAMDGVGTLRIAVRAASGRDGTDLVAVSVRDEGCGIPPEALDRIFEPFFTTKAVGRGTGLGLSQVFGFAKQSGGDVTAESRVGGGSTFTLTLPRVPPRGPARPAEAAGAGPVPGDGRRVLVVEDNPDVGAFATQVLQDLGYETTYAASGDEALLRLAEAGGAFDLVFSDVVMPGMSGVELARELRRRRPDLPVVLTSGYSHVLAQEGLGGFALLKKPYAADELARALETAARSRVGA